MVFSRVCKAMFATPTKDSVSAGSTMHCSCCSTVTCDAGTPMGTENPNGNQPNATLNTMSISSPSQNVGVEAST